MVVLIFTVSCYSIQMIHDRTRTALLRQLKGLGLDDFELTTHGPSRSSIERVTSSSLLAMLPDLKRRNLADCNLYIRGPRDCDHDLILIDDIGRFTPERMKIAGHDPAVVIETSPNNLQAWVRLGRPCSSQIRHEVARALAKLYGGDPGAVDPHQSGRLAGFTNRKPAHKSRSGFPFVLLLNAPGKSARLADDLIRSAETAIRDNAHDKARYLTQAASISASGGTASDNAVAAWTARYREKGCNPSNIDFSICCQLLKQGIHADDIAATLEIVADRKGKFASSYAERTVAAAVLSVNLKKDTPHIQDNTPSL